MIRRHLRQIRQGPNFKIAVAIDMLVAGDLWRTAQVRSTLETHEA